MSSFGFKFSFIGAAAVLLLTGSAIFAAPEAVAIEPIAEEEEAEPAQALRLRDGSVLVGTVVHRSDSAVVFRTRFAGELRISAKDVLDVEAAPPPAPAGDSEHAPIAVPAGPWSGRMQVGLNGATGNTERTTISGRGELNRTVNDNRLSLYFQGHYAASDGNATQNEVITGVTDEIDLTERHFAFVKAEFEHDEFEQLDLRATGTAGVGYFCVQEEHRQLKGRAGAGFEHEIFSDGSTMSNPLVEVGYDYQQDLSDWLRFTHALTYYPSIDAPCRDYRLVAETAGEIPIGKSDAWKLRGGMRNEYDAQPIDAVEKLDTTYFMNMVYQWK